MSEKILHIDYITFSESGQYVALAPKLDLCFNGTDSEKSIEYLKKGTNALIDFWKEKNILKEKVANLGLNGTTTAEQNKQIQDEIMIPYSYLRKTDLENGSFDLSVEF